MGWCILKALWLLHFCLLCYPSTRFCISMARILAADDDRQSIWKAFRFKSPDKEELFVKRYESSLVGALQIWCLTHLFFAVTIPCTFIPWQVAWGFYLAYVPNAVIAAVAFCSVTFIPRALKYTPLIISVAVFLMTMASALTVHLHTQVWLQHAYSTGLDLVVPLVNTPQAKAQLDWYLRDKVSASVLNALLAFQMPQMMLLAFVGLYQSTTVATILMPVGFILTVVLSPEVPITVVLLRGATFIIFASFLLAIMTSVTIGRRHSFSMERFSEASLRQSVEASRALEVATEASRKADSILNHTLKNTMADAAGEIDLFLENGPCDEVACAPLRQSVASLRRGMRSCRHRQAYLQLVAHQYTPSLQPVGLVNFVNDLTAGRHMKLDVKDFTACFDATLCSLILDNAISNAFKHGHPKTPNVQLTIKDVLPESGPRSLPEPAVRLKFIITNDINPARPKITEDYVNKVLYGRVGEGTPLPGGSTGNCRWDSKRQPLYPLHNAPPPPPPEV